MTEPLVFLDFSKSVNMNSRAISLVGGKILACRQP
jgi:hypothetical protein